jgi:hypothetical protein
MIRRILPCALLALALGGVACFPVPVPVPSHHDYVAEHRDPSIIIYERDPGRTDCWRHEEHWHCHR